MSESHAYWRAKELFCEALDKPSDQREAFLTDACKADPEVLKEVREMLEAHQRAVVAIETRGPRDVAVTRPLANAANLVGTHLGPYRILEVIGEGGMGIVYKAEQRQPIHRTVALKLIKLGMDTAQVIARFEGERQALALMNHPNVAAVYDAGATDTGRPYFVMEYVPGTPITSFCDRKKYTTHQRLELFLQACSALQHAHTKAIIHRDIKPGNILVTMQDDRPVVKVIDFGIAKATAQRLTEHTVFTETGQLIGTPEYMSPEQAEFTPIDIDTRSDIYSLGVVLYELLVGALPFEAKDLRQAAMAQIQAIIREVNPPRPSTRLSAMKVDTKAKIASSRGTQVASLQRELSGELEWIPLKAMRKDRARRYHTAIELAADIDNYLANRPLLAGPETARYRLVKFVRRNRAAVIASSTLAAMLIAGVTGTTIGLIGESRQRAIAEHERNIAREQTAIAEERRGEALRQEAEAKQQTEVAQAVIEFQSKMFKSADPDKLLGDKVTVVQTMAAATAELDAGALKNQPKVESAVRRTIGVTFRELGLYQQAEPNLLRAVEICRQDAETQPASLATALHHLGMLKQLQADYDAADAIFQEALNLRRAIAPNGDVPTAQTIDRIGAVLRDRGRSGEAIPLFREALEMAKQAGASRRELAARMNGLAFALHDQGKLTDAEPYFRDALALMRAEYPGGHSQLATALLNYADIIAAQGRWAEAEAPTREAVEWSRKYLPADHNDTALALGNLAVVIHRLGRTADAVPLCEEALAMRRRILPAGHPRLAESLSYLTLMLTTLGRLDEALTASTEGLEIARQALPPAHPKLAEYLGNYAMVQIERGNYVAAEAATRESLEIRRKSLPAGHKNIALSLNNVAFILQRQGKLADAQVMYREALDILRNALPANHPDIARSLNNLATLLVTQGEIGDAEAMFRESVTINRKALTPKNRAYGQTLQGFADVLEKQGKLFEAEVIHHEAVAALETCFGKESAAALAARLRHGQTLMKLQRFAEAEVELLATELGLGATTRPTSGIRTDCITALVKLYAEWDKTEPGKGHDKQRLRWEALATRATTQTTQPADR